MRKAILLSVALFALALPAGAAAQIVPPGNSAAAQYTETIPSSKGEESAQGPKKQVHPNQVIGAKTTKQLEEKGPEGAAVAEFTAETAPTTSAGGEESSGGESADTGNGNGKAANGKQGSGAGNGTGAGDGKGKADGNGNGSKSQGGGDEESSAAGGGAAAGGGNGTGSGPSGSSAVGEVASQATGVSSGALGLWLPIVLVAVVAWAGFMVWRRREGTERAV